MVLVTPTRLLILSVPTYFAFKSMGNPLIDSQAKMTFSQRCRLSGLKSEKYFITTEDGYILQLFRILSDGNKEEKVPIYFQHGSQDSAMWWIA